MLLTSNTLLRIDRAKIQSLKLANNFREAGFSDYADRMVNCCANFKATFFYDSQNIQRISISDVFLCRVRFCPVCQVFKSRKLSRFIFQSILALPVSATLKFVTLTQKNCNLISLKNEIRAINKAFTYFKRNIHFSNYLRKFEITFQKDSYNNIFLDANGYPFCHPHIHLLVDSSYISLNDVRLLWQKALKCSSYLPQCNIKSAKNSHRELSKYFVKNTDILSLAPLFLSSFLSQSAYQKNLTSGGYFASYFQQKKLNSIENSISLDDEVSIKGYTTYFRWQSDSDFYITDSGEIVNRSFEVFDKTSIYHSLI